MLVILAVPYLKPIIAPIQWYGPQREQWQEGVCLQTSSSTCGPACAATLLKQAGYDASEQELAAESFTYVGGTENWYLIRALRRRGINGRIVIGAPEPKVLPYPAIAGVRLGDEHGSGHFITILGKTPQGYVIGDPVSGREVMSRKKMQIGYYFTGFFIVTGQ